MANMAIAPSAYPGGGVLDRITAAQNSTRKALDCQAFIVSLSTKGTSSRACDHQPPMSRCNVPRHLITLVCAGVLQLCQHLRLLASPLSQDIRSMIGTIDADESTRIVRDFKSRLDSVSLTYDPLVDRMIAAAERRVRTFPPAALRDALYAWARTFVHTGDSSSSSSGSSSPARATLQKADKLLMMPYVVAMAYAVRVKLDVHFVESSQVHEAERLDYLDRSRRTVEQFVELLQAVVRMTLEESSLLEVALDYNLALTTYATLLAALRGSAQMMLEPHGVPRPIVSWDDGLSGIR